ncbi:hypothetical protein AAMO2058_000504100 [Amorphochlora amoebiformis]
MWGWRRGYGFPGAGHYGAKHKYNVAGDKWKHDKDRKDPAGLGDVAVGDEDKDITMRDLEEYQLEYENRYGFYRVVKVSYVVIGGLIGALVGTLVGTVAFQSTDVDLRYVMWGLLIGSVFGSIAIFGTLYINYYLNSKFDKEINAKREALRRKEQETIERHDEFVYYDGATEQGFCYRLLLCPHFGKITSERIIYSTEGERYWECSCKGLWSIITACWSKQVEQMDYDMVLDVSVEQSCTQTCLGIGTVVLHCESVADVSMIKEERRRLTDALNAEDERQLKSAIITADGIPSLKLLVAEAKALVAKLVKKRQEECKKAGNPFKPIYVGDEKRNSSKVIRVKDVSHPYSVMDDLSYRISKYTRYHGANKLRKDLDTVRRSVTGTAVTTEESKARSAYPNSPKKSYQKLKD